MIFPNIFREASIEKLKQSKIKSKITKKPDGKVIHSLD